MQRGSYTLRTRVHSRWTDAVLHGLLDPHFYLFFKQSGIRFSGPHASVKKKKVSA